MTRKDYELIAAALREALAYAMEDSEKDGVAIAAERIATALKADNSRFDKDRFIAASLT
jgi:hypothetical protein